jgi:hypothetical protein
MFEVVVTNGEEGVILYHGIQEWFVVVDAIERHFGGPDILMVQASPQGRTEDFHGRWR